MRPDIDAPPTPERAAAAEPRPAVAVASPTERAPIRKGHTVSVSGLSAYYGTERSASPGWANRLTVLTVRELITVDLAVGADFLGPTPLLVVHGTTDAFCSPDGARAVFERATSPAEILWLDTTNHIDLYDRPEYVDPAAERAAEFFSAHL